MGLQKSKICKSEGKDLNTLLKIGLSRPINRKMIKQKHRVLDLFVENPSRDYLFKEIQHSIRSRSDSFTYSSLNYFLDKEVLVKELRGGTSFYRISHTPMSIIYLSILAEYKAWNHPLLPVSSINPILDKLEQNFFSLLVTGS